MTDVALIIDFRYGLSPLVGPAPIVYVRADGATRVTRGETIETVRGQNPRTHYVRAAS
jgi:hypothetical protein